MDLMAGGFLTLASRIGPLAVTSVPEPVPLSLLVGGLLALGLMRRRVVA
jgi:hypothetical protein